MSDIKPCPFCGGEPVVDGKSDDVRVRCLQCGTQGSPRYFDTDDEAERAEADAIAAWNQRATTSSSEAREG